MSTEGVTYSVKELIAMLQSTLTTQLEDLARRLEKIEAKLDDKASNHRVDALEILLSDALGRIGVLEKFSAGTTAVTSFQRWLLGTVGIVILGGVITLMVFAIESAFAGKAHP